MDLSRVLDIVRLGCVVTAFTFSQEPFEYENDKFLFHPWMYVMGDHLTFYYTNWSCFAHLLLVHVRKGVIGKVTVMGTILSVLVFGFLQFPGSETTHHCVTEGVWVRKLCWCSQKLVLVIVDQLCDKFLHHRFIDN